MERALAIVMALAVTLVGLDLSEQTAAAHERRTVGPYQLVVGWLTEPAFAGVPNAVDLRVTDTRSANRPVEGLERTVTIDITQGGLTAGLPAPVRARFGVPGAYAADLIPTRAGDYTFHIKGRIESTDLDERFASGPGRFDEVRPAGELQYPDRVPSGAELTTALADLRAAADQSRLLGLGGLLAGLGALAAVLVRRRR